MARRRKTRGPHRDDFDYRGIGHLIDELRGRNVAGVVFAGDVPDDQLPDDVCASLDKMHKVMAECAKRGLCVKCGAKLDNWHRMSRVEIQQRGWLVYVGRTQWGTLLYGVCPRCAKDAGETIAYLVARSGP